LAAFSSQIAASRLIWLHGLGRDLGNASAIPNERI
jgi:hypothetical protein